VLKRRIRRLIIARLVAGDLRRWAIYLAATSAWRRYRKLAGKEPELLYRRVVGRGARVDMGTFPPLPRRFRSKAVHDALAAAARADLELAQAARGR
jgi:hypothetical protein